MSEDLATIDVPDAVRRYLRAHTAGDLSGAAATFTPDATVTDDGGTHRGRSAITEWLGRTSGEYSYTTTLVGAEREGGDRCTVTQHLEGDFPGGTVDLHYRFTLDQGLISRLNIAP